MKTSLEAIFYQSYLKPVFRGKVQGYDVFVGDGFVEEQNLPSCRRALNIDIQKPEWVTFWMAHMGKNFFPGAAMSFDNAVPVSQSIRVKRCLEDADAVLAKMKAPN